jgi:hypothetical protein
MCAKVTPLHTAAGASPGYKQWGFSNTRLHTAALPVHTSNGFFGRRCVKIGVNFKIPEVSAYSQIADLNVTDYCFD